MPCARISSLLVVRMWLSSRTTNVIRCWWWWLILGSSPYSPDAPRPYRRALCAPKSNINSGEPCSFTEVPDGPQSQNPNGLPVQERNPDSPGKQTSSRFPNRAPMEREARLLGILHISQKPHFSGSPVKDPSLKVPFVESSREMTHH